MAVEDLRVMGRATQGVKLINLKNSDSIAAVAKVMHDEDEVEDIDDTAEVNSENKDGTTLDMSQDENKNNE